MDIKGTTEVEVGKEEFKSKKQTLSEMKKRKNDIDQERKRIEEEIENLEMDVVVEKIKSYTPGQKAFMLSLLSHDRITCSDEHPMNGYSRSQGHADCNKCLLMEILNGDHAGVFDFSFSVDFERVGRE